MTVQTTAKQAGQYALNIALGTGDFVVEKARTLAGNMRGFDPRAFMADRQKQLVKGYDSLARRGESLRRSITSSAPVKRAADQTRSARTQVKAAGTSVKKALGANVQAGKTAAKKVG